MMTGPETQLAHANPTEAAAESRRVVPDDSFEMLRLRFPAIGLLKKPTSEFEIGLPQGELRGDADGAQCQQAERPRHEVHSNDEAHSNGRDLKLFIQVGRAFCGSSVSLLVLLQKDNLAMLRAVLRPESQTRTPEDP
jgi:hypothetical protein